MELDDALRLVQLAAEAIAKAGLVHAYGHCSIRLNKESFLVSAARPLSLAAHLPGVVCPVQGALPDGVLGEVRIHQQIYALRPEVGAVCRIMPPAVMALSTQRIVPVPRHGIGAYFPNLPLWDDPRLLRNDAAAAALAAHMGHAPAIVMRGNGAVIAAATMEQAITLAWFLEDAARIERDVRAMGFDPQSGRLAPEEIADRQVWAGGVAERMWDYLTG
ncbi:class II aldolase/adducin family protein [Novosphingobium sp. MMS21-SN21R]|uniref:class II aldolase/adducin family protein n=1 Tax=Novosphingobium sp. MMS21-SN21R TaxID=2969298 RepID=UPI002887F8B6|nr:class II aldolase/adducin family protein [Novosphingobium sp. MMS21-SN21R]MDT0508427.1 class II aldolase/adducin family protein [Novosphingobium sp. MMS21-SN21R]